MSRLADGRLVSGYTELTIVDGHTTRWARRGVGLDILDAWLGKTTTWLVGGVFDHDNPTLQIARYDGKAWERWTLPAEPATDVSGHGDDPWIANQTGDVYHLVGDEWQREATGLDDISDIAVTPAGEVWVWARTGFARRVGGKWTSQGLDTNARALDIAPDGTVMMLVETPNKPSTDPLTLMRWNGERFEVMGELPFHTWSLFALGRDKAIVLVDGKVSRWNGAEWTEPAYLLDRTQTLIELQRVHDRMLFEVGGRWFDLDSREEVVFPIDPKWIHGNASGRLWVISAADEIAFREG